MEGPRYKDEVKQFKGGNVTECLVSKEGSGVGRIVSPREIGNVLTLDL